MPKIQVLDKSVAELIAAGEVVERPASIVKELLENAIDAGATSISVEIEDGGISYIRITDNGCGIGAEELPSAFLRHATSKVFAAADLDSILTLGFRGEALASIAAVSKAQIITKTADGEGVSCRAEGGEVSPVEPAGCPDGTTIIVRDIFYNTPARMKFLKKSASEGSAVAGVVDKCALSHPEIAFRMRRDGKVTLQTAGNGDLLAVIYAIYGREFAGQMTPVDYDDDSGIRVTGYISNPIGAKPSRSFQTFFINARYVRSRTAMAALEQACKGKIMTGKFPCCVLNIAMDAGIVDVNVHPAKIEVRFADEKPVFNAVYFAVKTALQKLEQSILSGVTRHSLAGAKESEPHKAVSTFAGGDMPPAQERVTAQGFQVLMAEEQVSFGKPLHFKASNADSATSVRAKVEKPQYSTNFDNKKPLDYSILFVKDTEPDPFAGGSLPQPAVPTELCTSTELPERPIDPPSDARESDTREAVIAFAGGGFSPAAETVAPPEKQHRLLGELMGTYILLDAGDRLLLVDKHAAHERILYERLRDNIAYGNRQMLLSPQTVTLPREDYAALLDAPDAPEKLGFLVEDFGGSTVIVREVPIELPAEDVQSIIAELADKLRRGLHDLTPNALDRLYYSIACRGAVKAGDKNALPELAEIIKLLAENPQITHCPHGRPVSVALRKNDIEKMFGRQG